MITRCRSSERSAMARKPTWAVGEPRPRRPRRRRPLAAYLPRMRRFALGLAVLVSCWAVPGAAGAADLLPGWSGTVSGSLHDHAFNDQSDETRDVSTSVRADGSSRAGDGTATFTMHQHTVSPCPDGNGSSFFDVRGTGSGPSPRAIKVTVDGDSYAVSGGGDAT